jgi:hypothetical protein
MRCQAFSKKKSLLTDSASCYSELFRTAEEWLPDRVALATSSSKRTVEFFSLKFQPAYTESRNAFQVNALLTEPNRWRRFTFLAG